MKNSRELIVVLPSSLVERLSVFGDPGFLAQQALVRLISEWRPSGSCPARGSNPQVGS